MGVALTIVAIIISLIISYFLACEFFAVANAKGYYESKYLWICFFFGLVGYLLVIALPARDNKTQKDSATASLAETVRREEAKRQEEKIMNSGGWKCSCGRVNANYVSTCACGKSRRENRV